MTLVQFPKKNVLRSKISAEELPSVMAQMITDSGSASGDGLALIPGDFAVAVRRSAYGDDRI